LKIDAEDLRMSGLYIYIYMFYRTIYCNYQSHDDRPRTVCHTLPDILPTLW